MKNFKKVVALAIAASMAFTVFGCTTKEKSKKDKDDDSDISEKEVVKIAESFADAMIGMDAKGIEKISDDSAEKVDFEFDMKGGDDVYEYWFKKFSTEVDEDSVEIDDDTASVTITLTYPEIRSVDSVMTVEDWEDFIDESDDTTEEFTLEVSYDDDDEKLLVSNADKTVKSYMKIVEGVWFDVYEAPSYTTFGSLSTDKSTYADGDSVKISVDCDEIDELEGEEIVLNIIDPDDKSTYIASLYFYSNANTSFTQKLDGYDEGTYTVEAVCGDMTLTTTFKVEEGSGSGTGTGTGTGTGGEDIGSVMDSLSAAPAEYHGSLKDNVYTNEFFGFKMDMSGLDGYTFMSTDDLAGMGEGYEAYDFFAVGGNMEMGIIAVYQGDESLSAMFSLMTVDDEVEEVNVGGIDFYHVAQDDEFEMLFAIKDDILIFILAGGGDDIHEVYETFEGTISAI